MCLDEAEATSKKWLRTMPEGIGRPGADKEPDTCPKSTDAPAICKMAKALEPKRRRAQRFESNGPTRGRQRPRVSKSYRGPLPRVAKAPVVPTLGGGGGQRRPLP